MNKPYWLMTAKEKERARKKMVRQTQRSLKKQQKVLDKYQEKMLAVAQQAQESGSAREFQTASNALGSVIKYRHYIQALSLRMDIQDVMSSMMNISANTLKVMERISGQTVHIAEKMDIEDTLSNMEEAMDQMDSMLEQMDEILNIGADEDQDDETRAQITSMIEQTRIAQKGAVDAEIEELLAANGIKAKSI